MQPRRPQQARHPPDRRRQERGPVQRPAQEDGQQAVLLVRAAQDQGLPVRPIAGAVGAAGRTNAGKVSSTTVLVKKIVHFLFIIRLFAKNYLFDEIFFRPYEKQK